MPWSSFSECWVLSQRFHSPLSPSKYLCDIHLQLGELTQTHVHQVGDGYPTISSSIVPFCSCLQSFPASGSFPVSQVFASGGQSIGASASASILPMNIEGCFPLGLTGLILLQSNGLTRIFSSTTIWNHQFFGAQPSLWSNSHNCTWKNHSFD